MAKLLKTGAVCCAALALGCSIDAANSRAQSPPTDLNIVMMDYKFVPDHLTFHAGTRYRLHLENHGKETHEFTAPTFFATAKIETPGALNSQHTEAVVQPGQSKDIVLTPEKPGTYDLRCADHDWNGMVGGIKVE